MSKVINLVCGLMFVGFIFGSSKIFGGVVSCDDFRLGEGLGNANELYKSCLNLARSGNANAQWNVFLIGRFMACGGSSSGSEAIANKWRDKALVSGSIDGLVYVAKDELSQLGASVGASDRDRVEIAVKKLEYAAKFGSSEANYELYRLYGVFIYSRPPISGLGSFSDAVDRLVKSSSLEGSDAANTLGNMYKWIEKNKFDARVRDGANGADSYGLSIYLPLARELLRKGLLEPGYGAAAEKYFLRAAMLGNESAMRELISGYTDGIFGKIDLIKARSWVELYNFGNSGEGVDFKSSPISGAEQSAVCKNIADITSRSRFVPISKISIKKGPGKYSVVAKCTSFPETYGQSDSCVSIDNLSPPGR